MSASAEKYLCQQLAEYVVSVEFADLTEAVVAKTKHQLTYLFGLALAGLPTVTSRDARGLARELSPYGGAATVIGESFTASAMDAAMANCSAVNGTELDDMFILPSPAMGTHPGLVTQPVAWALGEQLKCSGGNLLTAVVAGYEVLAKLGSLAWAPSAPAMRRQVIPFGPFGATAVAAKLLGLSVDQAARAFGYAANFAMGVSEGAVITHYYGIVCRNGILAALLGRTRGLVAPSVLEGRYGFFRTFFGENPDGLDQVFERLAIDRAKGAFDIMHTSIKVHPGTGMNIVPIELVGQLVERHEISATDVESVELRLPDERSYHTASQGTPPYANEREATYSLPFMFAVILLDGWLNPLRYQQYDNPELLNLAHRVSIIFEPDHALRYACVAITTVDGATHELAGDQHAFHLPEDRLGWLAARNDGQLAPERLAQLARLLGDLEHVQNFSDVMAATRSAPER
jgi:2-methylcitrate dehydratase PrpD